MKIGLLTMEKYENRKPNSVGSSRIRGRWVMKYCQEIEEFKNGVAYDVVIYQKAYWKDHMQRYQGIKIFDLCDPDWFDGRPIVEVLEYVDAVTVPTQALQKYIQQMTDKPVVVIPDRIDPDDHLPVKERHIGRARTAVWFGYGQNQAVLDQAVGVIQSMGLQLVVISNTKYYQADVNVPYDYATFNQELIKHDIVVLPTYTKDIKFIFKSNNKTLTARALRMPVANEVPDLERFLDPLEREREAEMRYNEVIGTYHAELSGREFLALIYKLQAGKGGNNGTI